jgi:hypothetical protein
VVPPPRRAPDPTKVARSQAALLWLRDTAATSFFEGGGRHSSVKSRVGGAMEQKDTNNPVDLASSLVRSRNPAKEAVDSARVCTGQGGCAG